MNPHILFVMKWLDDPTQFTKEQIEENRRSALAAAVYDAYAANVAVYANAANAANAAAAANAANAANAAEKWINTYFEITGEDRKNYE